MGQVLKPTENTQVLKLINFPIANIMCVCLFPYGAWAGACHCPTSSQPLVESGTLDTKAKNILHHWRCTSFLKEENSSQLADVADSATSQPLLNEFIYPPRTKSKVQCSELENQSEVWGFASKNTVIINLNSYSRYGAMFKLIITVLLGLSLIQTGHRTMASC